MTDRRIKDRRYDQSQKGQARQRRYLQSPKGIVHRKARDQRYEASPAAAKRRWRYEQTEKGKARVRKYQQSPKGKTAIGRTRAILKRKRRQETRADIVNALARMERMIQTYETDPKRKETQGDEDRRIQASPAVAVYRLGRGRTGTGGGLPTGPGENA